ncbi:MAG: hypothetical protein VB138_08190, partial [Burkholderia sp.]
LLTEASLRPLRVNVTAPNRIYATTPGPRKPSTLNWPIYWLAMEPNFKPVFREHLNRDLKKLRGAARFHKTTNRQRLETRKRFAILINRPTVFSRPVGLFLL